MECYCEPEEGEPCTVWVESWRVAKKQHQCCECKEAIKPGERYAYTFLVFDGEPDAFKRCEFCANEARRIEGLVPGDLACAIVYELRGNQPTRDG